MTDASSFQSFVPGFEFLKSFMKSSTSAMPGIGQWVAPTMNPEEIEKRIEELRTVQFWLEQNARLISATIQGLEVQRMTLATLKTMNVKMGDLRDSLTIHPETKAPAAAPAANAPAQPGAKAASGQEAPLVDPMKWWGALTQQFTELAANAMKEVSDKAPGAASVKAKAAAAASAASPAASKAPAKKAAKPARKSSATARKSTAARSSSSGKKTAGG